MEVVFIPQVTVFLKPATYLAVARKADAMRGSCSAVLRELAEEEFEEVSTHGRKKGK